MTNSHKKQIIWNDCYDCDKNITKNMSSATGNTYDLFGHYTARCCDDILNN